MPIVTRKQRSIEGGFTLVELLVVLIILGVVGSMATVAVTTTLRASSATTARVIALDELQTAMQRVSRDLRAAELFIITDTTAVERKVTADVFRDGQVVRVTYSVEERDGVDVLIREDTGQTLITLVDNDAEPVFTYLDAQGEPIPEVDDYTKARQIRIRFIRGIEGRSPVIVESLVNVRNTRYEGGAL